MVVDRMPIEEQGPVKQILAEFVWIVKTKENAA